ncbi:MULTISPECIES: adenosylcobinamide-GDP ribazoletransferase [Paenibacillus]|jgi:adenosylcobinamide-GDP ribazoletransferase|uniref:adenosylcobinamide-GDP ribazoletransferase n=1 Tax=Paenibacillus TaxID=44249 RepID=UPI000D312B80|nr:MULTISPECIES: adenosylcobinamide-GDP ribazoletransferase [Paenibacillus]MDP9676330.1 adenosylcobinamide-GDP ribazoletransferase [Paenibacillus jamilae]KAF6585121.1 adenosylcobinamide-GDP ribazoletransferase [Paenibacillus sp. EKM211P]MBY0020685.1 adenosylcobinamide-GDP ribazoletransferase [Paenibacillus polymyxa]MBY0058989.1 adenosylcobinamide-GDP ribazoletransferase [Paenibacillus polymyxa]MBY0069576.1 adenosylcobinamide-GDP ribazoletransferase [Paenibacillus polymyxa]
MSRERQAVAAAFQFLTRLPVKAELDFSPELLKRSASYYPLVGVIIGIIVWGIAALTAMVLPPLPCAILTLAVWVWLTGGLHLDGWMDAADALFSYRSRERMLEIMKDSRVGAMGVIACVLLLMLKAALLYTVLVEQNVSGLLLLPMVWSRWFMVHAMKRWPKARNDDGLAARFADMSGGRAGLAVFWAVVVTLGAAAGQYILAGPATATEGSGNLSLAGTHLQTLLWYSESLPIWIGFALLPLLAYGVGTFTANRINRRLGGLTGDIYGALNELLETVLLLFIVILYGL